MLCFVFFVLISFFVVATATAPAPSIKVKVKVADLSFEAKKEGLKKYLAESRNNDDLHSFKVFV